MNIRRPPRVREPRDEELRADTGLVERVPASRLWERDRPSLREELVRRLAGGRCAEPPASVLGPLEDPAPEVAGICCSGGGIRSASFNLGVLQVLQERRRLERAKYLAAVSGGSYIASAVAMVAKTWDPGGRDPAGDDSDPDLIRPDAPPFHEGSPEEQYLRNRVSYMAPTGGGKVLLVWRILLGLLVNLALIGAGVTLLASLLVIYYRTWQSGLSYGEAGPVTAEPHTGIWTAGLVAALSGVGVGLASVLGRFDREGVRRGLEVWSLRLLALGAAVLAVESVLPAVLEALKRGFDAPQVGTVGSGFTATLGGILAAVLVQVRARVADPKAAVEAAKAVGGRFTTMAPRARMALVYLAATILGPLLVASMLVGMVLLQLELAEEPRVAIALVALVVGLALLLLGDLTTWSLHPFYRRRLCSAFALKRVKDPLDPGTSRAVERRQGDLVPLSETGVVPRLPHWESKSWPTLVVCAAANVSDPGATPPGRGVTSFTFSAWSMGGPLVGGVDTRDFEDAMSPKRQRDFTLPAAVAISGAAVAPSMGKLTRPSVRFLMALANVRLGVWVPNPRRMESFLRMREALEADPEQHTGPVAKIAPTLAYSDAARRRAMGRAIEEQRYRTYTMPRPSPRYLLKELLGRNSVNDRFLYVTDGGHYENLGLVELLRRGCTSVYCFDASGGRPLAALGDAIALARSELGVEVTFAADELARLQETGERRLAERCFAVGGIRYTRSSAGEPIDVRGTIVYVPTVMTADLPWDVQAFRGEDPDFPHHSTLDQLFTDQKFEAYRVLGRCAGAAAVEAMDAATGRGEGRTLRMTEPVGVTGPAGAA